eukprot:Pgem_evm1s12697
MTATYIIETYVVPSLGAILCVMMSSVSIPKIYRAQEKEQKDVFDIFPYSSLFGFGLSFVLYALVHDFQPFVFWNCFLSVLCSTWSTLVIYSMTTNKQKKRIVEIQIIISLSVIGSVGFTAGYIPQETSQLVAGVLGCLFSVVYYASPLNLIYTVIKEKNSRYFQKPMLCIALLNSSLWATFGATVQGDVLFILPNAIGTVLNVIALILAFKYPNKPCTVVTSVDNSVSVVDPCCVIINNHDSNYSKSEKDGNVVVDMLNYDMVVVDINDDKQLQ